MESKIYTIDNKAFFTHEEAYDYALNSTLLRDEVTIVAHTITDHSRIAEVARLHCLLEQKDKEIQHLQKTIDAILYDLRKLSCEVENDVDHYRKKDEISIPAAGDLRNNAMKYKKRVLDGYYRSLSFPLNFNIN